MRDRRIWNSAPGKILHAIDVYVYYIVLTIFTSLNRENARRSIVYTDVTTEVACSGYIPSIFVVVRITTLARVFVRRLASTL